MIKELVIENVKSFKKAQKVQFAPLTVLVGENGAGKSTYLQILATLRQSINQSKLKEGPLIRESGFHIFANDPTNPITIGISGAIQPDDVEPYSYLKDLDYEMQWILDANGSRTTTLKLSLKKEFEALKSRLGKTTNAILDIEWDRNAGQPRGKSFFYSEKYSKIMDVEINCSANFPPTIGPNSSRSEPDYKRIHHVMSSINKALLGEFQRVFLIPALRGMNTSEYGLERQNVVDFIEAGDFRQQAQRLASALEFNRDEADHISDITSIVLNRKTRTRLIDGPNVVVEMHNGKKWIGVMHEGFGANPLIQLAFQLVITPRNSMILLEEPEIHLYPAAQKRLMQKMMDIANADNKQLIITTHSESILLSAIRMMRQDAKKTNVRIYLVRNNTSEGTSEVTEVTEDNLNLFSDFFSATRSEVADLHELTGF